VDLPIVLTILFEDVPQEHQLGLQAVFITDKSGSEWKAPLVYWVGDDGTWH
jgi:hypothetical protein